MPVGPIYSIADIASDPQYAAREMFTQVTLPGGRELKIPSVVPKLSSTPGETRWIGPQLGAHNQEVFGELLGLSEIELTELRASGVV